MVQALVIDDSAVIRKVARRILEGLAIQVEEVDDGEKALASCTAAMPDLVLLDWNMPGMDGCALLRALRAMPGGRKPKIVFCTTERDMALIARALHAGASDYMMKPFDRAVVLAKVAELGFTAREAA